MKIVFALLRLIEISFCVLIIVACFVPCDVKRKDNEKTWLTRFRQYSLYDPNLLFEQMDDMYDSRANGISFKILHTSIGLSSFTAFTILISLACRFCCVRKSSPVYEMIIFLMASAIWVPFTFCFLWTIIILWSENSVLTNYSRPVSWVVAGGGCTSLTCFLLLDLFFNFLSNIRRFFSSSPSKLSIRNSNNNSSNYYAAKQARLAVSLNSVDLDADCENVKVL